MGSDAGLFYEGYLREHNFLGEAVAGFKGGHGNSNC